jgi:hypothetical protein
VDFITEAWQPVNVTKIRLDEPREVPQLQTYELRHWMFFVGLAALALTPIVALTLSSWAAAPLLASLGLFLLSAAILLVPQAELDEYESGEDRLDT